VSTWVNPPAKAPHSRGIAHNDRRHRVARWIRAIFFLRACLLSCSSWVALSAFLPFRWTTKSNGRAIPAFSPDAPINRAMQRDSKVCALANNEALGAAQSSGHQTNVPQGLMDGRPLASSENELRALRCDRILSTFRTRSAILCAPTRSMTQAR
jgi:hypothetical protein